MDVHTLDDEENHFKLWHHLFFCTLILHLLKIIIIIVILILVMKRCSISEPVTNLTLFPDSYNLEEEEKPADLNQRVIFKSKKKKDDVKDTVDEDKSSSNTAGKSDKKPKKERKQEKPVKNLLSFVEDD